MCVCVCVCVVSKMAKPGYNIEMKYIIMHYKLHIYVYMYILYKNTDLISAILSESMSKMYIT